MMCKKPFMKGILPFGCGQCLPCRINRHRLWSHRIMLESMKHSASSFVTLTYDQKHIPETFTLVPRDTQLFLKKLRKRFPDRTIRYFIVGEYGDQTWRPHYHAALFGVGLEDAECVDNAWGKGFTYTGDLTPASAQYIGQYVTKKMTSKDDIRLSGKHPEFARMSLKPGIGALAIKEIVDVLTTDFGTQALINEGDVPRNLNVGSKSFPLGRYLRSLIRKGYGISESTEKIIKDENLQKFAKKMRELHEEIKGATQDPSITRKKLVDYHKQHHLNLETRYKIRKKGQSL